jgi:hypothetical protein
MSEFMSHLSILIMLPFCIAATRIYTSSLNFSFDRATFMLQKSVSNSFYQLSTIRKVSTETEEGDDDNFTVGTTGLVASASTMGESASVNPMSNLEWRKHQLLQLENKMSTPKSAIEPIDAIRRSTASSVYGPALAIETENQLQPMWKSLESRVKSRRPRTETVGLRSGRSNIKNTDEDLWLQAGLYSNNGGSVKK